MVSSGCINQVEILGRLGTDPDLKFTPSGSAVCNISVATSYKYTDKATGEAVEKTEWHRIVFWNKSAEVVGKYLKKGSRIFVKGMLQTRSWDDKDGTKRYTTEIKADDFVLLDSNGKQEARADQHGPEDDPQGEAPAKDQAPADPMDDDLPF